MATHHSALVLVMVLAMVEDYMVLVTHTTTGIFMIHSTVISMEDIMAVTTEVTGEVHIIMEDTHLMDIIRDTTIIIIMMVTTQ